MDLRLIAVLLLVPLLDLMLLVVVADYIGLLATVAVVVLTALVGLMLVRAEGRHTLRRIQEKLAVGQPPTDELVDGALLLVAGALFVTPGLVTDATALVFALPPTRYPVRVAIKRWFVTPYLDAKTGGLASGNVYVGGFPGEDGGEGAGRGEGDRRAGGAGTAGGDTVDIGEDDYRTVDDDREEPGEGRGQPDD